MQLPGCPDAKSNATPKKSVCLSELICYSKTVSQLVIPGSVHTAQDNIHNAHAHATKH